MLRTVMRFGMPAELGGYIMQQTSNWYALSVKNQHERVLERVLAQKGFESFAPVATMRRNWSDRVVEASRAVFPGYVFCRFALPDRIAILNTPGVSRIVSFGGQPAPIPESELEAIRTAAASKLAFRPWPKLKVGDPVRIERGPLRGMEGTLIRERDTFQFVIGVTLLQRFIAVEIDADAVLPIVAAGLTVERLAKVVHAG